MNNIESYWATFSKKNLSKDIHKKLPDHWMFGDGSQKMGDELAELVLKGIKKATCSAKKIHEIEKEKYPQVGQYDIVLNGRNEPVCIIQYTEISIIPMNKVTAEFAALEGEGDLTYKYWYDEHVKFFKNEFMKYSLKFSQDIELVCQKFEVVNCIK
ncbi:ASCH domain-containing protein [Mammaliicoccus sciuri]|uniref:ASCH domain-containing protein n=1 Tax=Mammaliicoccus sciuri TaxID=1296 RepID=UPI0034DD82FA